jgi:hypothetical protein
MASSTRRLTFDDQGMTTLRHTLPNPDATWLSAQRNRLADAAGAEQFPGLVTLNLAHNIIADLTHLASLGKLTVLILNNNRIASLAPLASLAGSLTTLVVSHNPLTDSSAIARLSHLTKLSATDCSLTALPWKGLEDVAFPKLLDLRLNNNNLQDLQGIEHCPALLRLSVKNNQLTKLKALEVLPLLTHLTIEGNPAFADGEKATRKISEGIPYLRYLNDHPTVRNEKAVRMAQLRKRRRSWGESHKATAVSAPHLPAPVGMHTRGKGTSEKMEVPEAIAAEAEVEPAAAPAATAVDSEAPEPARPGPEKKKKKGKRARVPEEVQPEDKQVRVSEVQPEGKVKKAPKVAAVPEEDLGARMEEVFEPGHAAVTTDLGFVRTDDKASGVRKQWKKRPSAAPAPVVLGVFLGSGREVEQW